jgi:hypothetical protein
MTVQYAKLVAVSRAGRSVGTTWGGVPWSKLAGVSRLLVEYLGTSYLRPSLALPR